MLTQFFKSFRENRSWIALSILFFGGAVFLTYTALQRDPSFFALLEEASLGYMKELGERIFSGSPFYGAAILFLHNFLAVLQIIFFGLLLGLSALFSSVLNGAVLGALAFQLGREGIAPLPFLLAGILPHGILELPVFFLSAAFGLKLGYHVIFPLPRLSRKDSLAGIFREIIAVMPAFVLFLALAAMIEVFITPVILRLFAEL